MTTEIEYFEHAELPGRKMFRCEARKATLTTQSCADMWRESQKRGSHCRTWLCRNCPIGAQHAGFGEISLSPLRGTNTCARCHRSADRLIRGHVCVSCYNREREVVVGANARGRTPVKHPPVYRLSIRAIVEGMPRRVTVERAASTEELVVATLRDTPKRVLFAFQGHRVGPMVQGELCV